MALTNEQYSALKRHYDDLQMRNAHVQNQRYREVIRKIPEISVINQNLASSATKLCIEGLSGKEDSPKEMRKIAQASKKRRQQLLTDSGFPADYLDPVYTCPACRDTGRLQNGQHCECFQKYSVQLFYKDRSQKNQTEKENFETFRTDYYDDKEADALTGLTPFENIQVILDKSKSFVKEFDTNKGNLLLYGNTGVGKTFLINCIYKELTESAHSVIYLTAYELFSELEKIKFNRSILAQEASQRMDSLLECELLIVDDLGSELGNSFTTSQLFHIINERHLKDRSIIISTNLSIADLKEQYGERIFSRMVSNFEFLKIQGEDIRLKT